MTTIHGTITSAKMQNTVTVTTHRQVLHPIYKKRFRVSKKFLADTNGMQLSVGDEVTITECRPLSKLKHFKVTEVTKKVAQVSEMGDEAAVHSAIHREKKAPQSSDSSDSSSK